MPSERLAATAGHFYLQREGKRYDRPTARPHSAPQPFHGSQDSRSRHGLTGQLCVFTPQEQQAYEKHSKVVLEALAPVGDFERGIAQSTADDQWRLERARAFEASTFGLGQADAAFAQARTWEKAAHNLQPLTVYEQRIRRAVDKKMSQLNALQTERKQVAAKAMEQAKLLYPLSPGPRQAYRPKNTK